MRTHEVEGDELERRNAACIRRADAGAPLRQDEMMTNRPALPSIESLLGTKRATQFALIGGGLAGLCALLVTCITPRVPTVGVWAPSTPERPHRAPPEVDSPSNEAMGDLDQRLEEPPQHMVVTEGLPDNKHRWRYIDFDPDGYSLVPIGAPCNGCASDDSLLASIARLKILEAGDAADLEVLRADCILDER